MKGQNDYRRCGTILQNERNNWKITGIYIKCTMVVQIDSSMYKRQHYISALKLREKLITCNNNSTNETDQIPKLWHDFRQAETNMACSQYM